jgi:hypothetical protein
LRAEIRFCAGNSYSATKANRACDSHCLICIPDPERAGKQPARRCLHENFTGGSDRLFGATITTNVSNEKLAIQSNTSTLSNNDYH